MIKQLYVFGNIGKLSIPPKSGGQSSARRVIKGLEYSGYKIVPIVRHRAELEGKFLHIVEILWFALIDLLKIIKHLIFGNRSRSAFLMLTYGGPLVPYEFVITCIVRLLGYKTIIYMKGGQFMDYFRESNKLYKFLCRKTFDMSTQAWFEGKESLDIVEGISSVKCVYFPNYIFESDIPTRVNERPMDCINICYFGRVAPNKNTHLIIEIFEKLCEKHNNIHLTIIGGPGQSIGYVTHIDDMISKSPYKDKITRKGLTPFSEIKDILQTQHFFVFPSHEPCEGHSNSLNEAMSQGVIPIVSDYHFNSSVVGDDRLIVKGFDANSYYEKIEYIIKTCDLMKLSESVYHRIKNTFTFTIINTRIAQNIESIS